jgi:Zn-dependent protease
MELRKLRQAEEANDGIAACFCIYLLREMPILDMYWSPPHVDLCANSLVPQSDVLFEGPSMPNNRQSSIHLFRLAGIDLFLHWSWFFVAAFEIAERKKHYSSIGWNVLEYLTLFLIVLLHEYGHALACRQVGGTANRIVLWPLGGVAYVNPPPRPGATLWSIAAGPLVNVALLFILSGVRFVDGSLHLAQAMPNAHAFLRALWMMNLVLLIFNLMPFYPLDGGQILRSLLWFAIGRARSLMAATVIGFGGVAVFLLLAVWTHSIWLGVLAAYFLLSCWTGLRQARILLLFARLPRREGYECPSCKMEPPLGAHWKCSRCTQRFDTFESRALCPRCGEQYPATQCLHCGSRHTIAEWMVPVAAALE